MKENRVKNLFISPTTPLLEVLRVHAQAAALDLPAGIALVVEDSGVLVGTITDGDVRRALLKHDGVIDIQARAAMNPDPIVFPQGMPFREILALLPAELARRNRRARRFLGKVVLVDDEHHPVGVVDYHQLWEQRVASHRHVVVVGLGYVGLTLALVLAESNFRVTGVDVNKSVIDLLERGESHVHEVGLDELLREKLNTNFFVSTEIPKDGDVFIIAVGTPVHSVEPGVMPTPILDYLRDAVTAVGRRLMPGGLVILRSTVPPGMSQDVVLPLLEEVSGLEGGTDFHLAFAPERTVEGNAINELRNLPQVIGGINEDSVEATAALFRDITSNIIRVESLEAAEMVKLLNNCFRDLVFSFANELSQIASVFDLDIVEVIRAANQGYPRDPIPLPSPGVGGPCLTKDPYILAWAVRQHQFEQSLSLHGRKINESMIPYIAERVIRELETLGKKPETCSVLVCGLSFKGEPETTDLRGSTALEIALLLQRKVGIVYGHDPVLTEAEIARTGLKPIALPVGFKGQDVVLFLNNHRSYQQIDVFAMARALNVPGIVYDGWHVFRDEEVLSAGQVVYMGLSFTRSSVGSEAASRIKLETDGAPMQKGEG